MSVSVWFRGPMLFVKDGAEVARVLIPDSRGVRNFPGDPLPNNKTVPHYAGILINATLIRSIDDWDITIGDGSAGHAIADASILKMIPLNQMVNTAGKDPLTPVSNDAKSVTSVVEIFGGTVTAEKPSTNKYTFPSTHNTPPAPWTVPIFAKWTTSATTVTMVLRSRKNKAVELVYNLGPNDEVYVFNFDEIPENPTAFNAAALNCTGAPIGTFVDEDFRWLYHLLVAPAIGWAAWRNKLPLPAPTFECAVSPTASPGNGDCFCAVWE